MLKIILLICWIISFSAWIYFLYKVFNVESKEEVSKYRSYMWMAVAAMNIFALLMKFAV